MIWMKVGWGVTALAFVVLILWWYPFFAYPLLWQKAVRKGTSWFYLPHHWTGWRSSWVSKINKLIPLVGGAIGGVCMHLWLPHPDGIYEAIVGLTVIIACLIIQWVAFHLRHRQQVDAYWNLRKQLGVHYENQGKDLSDSEIAGLTAFRHQNALREADLSGKLLPVLAQRAKLETATQG